MNLVHKCVSSKNCKQLHIRSRQNITECKIFHINGGETAKNCKIWTLLKNVIYFVIVLVTFYLVCNEKQIVTNVFCHSFSIACCLFLNTFLFTISRIRLAYSIFFLLSNNVLFLLSVLSDSPICLWHSAHLFQLVTNILCSIILF